MSLPTCRQRRRSGRRSIHTRLTAQGVSDGLAHVRRRVEPMPLGGLSNIRSPPVVVAPGEGLRAQRRMYD